MSVRIPSTLHTLYNPALHTQLAPVFTVLSAGGMDLLVAYGAGVSEMDQKGQTHLVSIVGRGPEYGARPLVAFLDAAGMTVADTPDVDRGALVTFTMPEGLKVNVKLASPIMTNSTPEEVTVMMMRDELRGQSIPDYQIAVAHQGAILVTDRYQAVRNNALSHA